MDFRRTFRAVFGPVGAGDEQRPADGAPLGVQAVEQRHFLLPVVPVVPGGGAAAGQGTGNGSIPPPGRQAVRRLACGRTSLPNHSAH